MKRDTEDMKLWLFDLAHGNLDEKSVVRGFLKYYALHDMTLGNVIQDIVFHTHYGEAGVMTAKETLELAFTSFS